VGSAVDFEAIGWCSVVKIISGFFNRAEMVS
jgi:hypothetical protein